MKTNLSKTEKPRADRVSLLKVIKPIIKSKEHLLRTEFIKIDGIEIY